MRARWAGLDENIGTKMCWKLVDDNSGEIICRSTIRSVIEPSTANLQIDPLEPLNTSVQSLEQIEDNPNASILDDFLSLADFEIPISHTTKSGPVDSIPASTKSQAWQDIERSQLEVRILSRLTIMTSLPSLYISEIMGRGLYLRGNNLNLFFETNLGSQDWT